MGIRKYQITGEEAGPRAGILTYVTYSVYEGEWKSIRHTHRFAELFYVKSGKGKFVIEEKEFPIIRGDLIIINPDVEHTEVSMEGSAPLEYIALGMEQMRFSFGAREEHFMLDCTSVPYPVGMYFDTILKEVEGEAAGYQRVCQNLAELLCLYLNRLIGSGAEQIVSRDASRECSRMKRYIDSNYQEDITLDSLAQMAHLNKYYFVHAFTKFYGQSPMSYLSMRRLQMSCDLLKTADYSIAEIAQLSGFSSPSYFAQCFRKTYGMTAAAYRRKQREENKKKT